MMMTMMMITKAESWLSLSCCGWQADVAKFAENVHVALHLFSGVAVCLFFSHSGSSLGYQPSPS